MINCIWNANNLNKTFHNPLDSKKVTDRSVIDPYIFKTEDRLKASTNNEIGIV